MEEENPSDLPFQISSITLVSILSLLTVVVNGSGIYVINKSKELSASPSSYLIRNLLVIHLIQGSVVFPFYAAKKANVDHGKAYQIICDVFRSTYMTMFYAAVYTVFFIAIERLIAVLYVMRYRELVTKRRVLLCIIALWSFIIPLCLIPFRHPSGHPEMEGIFNLVNYPNNTVNINGTYSVQCHYNQSKVWTISMLFGSCLVPYVIIVVIYQVIACRIHQVELKGRHIAPAVMVTGEEHQRKREMSKHKKMTKVAVLISFVYWFAWLPSVLYYVLWSVCPDICFPEAYKHSRREKYVGFTTKFLAFLDGIASPIIYCLSSEVFRHRIPCCNGQRLEHVEKECANLPERRKEVKQLSQI